jgi:hypothetical protein
MKKWILFFAIFFVYASNASADVIPEGDYHYETNDVVITNLNDYPDIALLSFAGSGDDNVYPVTQNVPLQQSYTWGGACNKLLAINKTVLEAEGGIDAADRDVLIAKYTPAQVISPSHGWVAGIGPDVVKTYKYRITAVTADKVSLLYDGVE